ncbi:alpha/beta fold hydrolase [Rhodococcus sp. NPDC058521]|uniref:alpha/beta fold hydrolase n=1 Tax=Rhodococcus sp. NPDC058521 TaxID=3346536 RepID=UPI0036583F25
MSLSARRVLIGGAASAAALGAVTGTTVWRSATRSRGDRRRRNARSEDFTAMYRDRRSVVRSDDGTPLVVREVGPDDAPVTAVFVHGFCLESRSWHFQRRDLEERWGSDVRMVFYDQRGHGASGMPEKSSCTIGQLGEDLAAVVRAKAVTGPLVLVGHSMGGMSILAFARRYPIIVSTRVAGVGLVSTTAAGLAESGVARNLQNPVVDAFRFAVRTSPELIQSMRAMVRALIKPVLRAASFGTDVSPAVYRFSASMLDATSVVTVVNFLRTLELHDESTALPVLAHTPAVVICGDDDMVIPFGSSRELAEGLPGSELVRVPGAGHLVQLEFPDVVTDAVDRLMRRVRPTNEEGRRDVG